MPLLSVDNVTKRFGSLLAVSKVSFDLNEGEILGLIGPNGAGKSTLFNMIAGRYKPDGGKIFFEGKRIDGKKSYEVCQLGISRTYQLVKPFLNQTVFENVLLASIFGKRSDSESHEAAAKAIGLVELEQIQRKYVVNLPFIDRRKVELARAIASGGKLVLLDEPIAGLNPAETSQFMDIIRKIASIGFTVFIIEHVMRAMMGLSTRIIVLDHGVKIADGKPENVVNDIRVIQVYLGE